MSNPKNIFFGRQPVLEALQNDVLIDRLLIYHGISGDNVGEILELAKQKGVPISRVPNEKLDRVTRKNHQGMIAYGGIIEYQSVQDVVSHLFEQGENPFFILLDGITDVRNMGAIIRSAVCCGVHAIIFSEKNAAPIYEDMVKTSAGALTQMNFCREKSINVALDTLKMNGIKIYSSDLNAKKALRELEMTEPLCIVLGAEDHGISSTTRKASDEQFIIPMVGEFDSFNVSVANGIICYEVMTKRGLVNVN
jgi:23S rRNA (guanosine2251-2'-O)-methyltransferase